MVERTITVTGMTCEHCVNAVTAEVSRIASVRSVDIDLTGGRVTVASDQPLDDAELKAAVEEAGYEIRV
jgi:copper chaperone